MALEWFVISAFAAMLCWGVGDFLIQKSTRRVGDVETLAAIGLVGAIGLLPFVVGDFEKLFSWPSILILGVLGLVHFVSGLIDFEALKRGKISVVDVIIELELPVSIFLGVLFLGDKLSSAQWLLVVPIFLGVVLIASRSFSFKNVFRHLEKGVLLALIAAVLFGVLNFLTDFSVNLISPIGVIWFSWLVIAVCTCSYLKYRGKLDEFYANVRKSPGLLIFTGLIDSVAWVFYAIALVGGSLSIITAITEAYPVIALLLGVFLNRERVKGLQWFGAALALCASIALAFTL